MRPAQGRRRPSGQQSHSLEEAQAATELRAAGRACAEEEARAPARRAEGAAANDCILVFLVVDVGGRGEEEEGKERRGGDE